MCPILWAVAITHDEAVCLRHREWSETSQTVILLTRAGGLINGLAKGSRREKAAFSGGFELLQLGQIGYIRRPEKDLTTLTEWDLTNAFAGLRTRYRPTVLAMFAAEMTVSLLATGDPHPRAFDAFCEMLDTSATAPTIPTETGCVPFTRYIATLLDETGQLPDLRPTTGASVCFFDPDHAAFVPASPGLITARDPFDPAGRRGVWPVRSDTASLLDTLVRDATWKTEQTGDPRRWTRAARFLAAWSIYRAGRRPASLDSFLRITQK